MPNLFKRRAAQAGILATVLVLLSGFVGQPLYAITMQQLHVFEDDIDWFNFSEDDVNNGSCPTGTTGGDANLTVGTDFSLGPITDGKGRRLNLMKALIASQGLSPVQAAGVVGNFMLESGGQNVPPNVNEGGQAGPPKFSGGYGWAQWTGPRQRTFIDYAVKNGYMVSNQVDATDAADFAYLINELTTGYKSTITQLKTKTSIPDATRSFESTFESAGVPNIGTRIGFAQQVFDEFNGGGATSTPTSGVSGSNSPACGNGGGGATVVGKFGFPLIINKSGITNRTIFKNGTTDKAGHPYTAYDILAPTGTPVVAFLPGTVTTITTDKCPGRMVSIYNQESNMVVSYLHMNMTVDPAVTNGAQINTGQRIGQVGTTANGCTVAHLHIDAAAGRIRPGCKRESCPPANAAKFLDIGPQLFQGFQALPD